MTISRDDVALTRPEPAASPGPLDDAFYDLVEQRFRRLVRDNPILATYLGIHAEDDRLGDGTRDQLLGELAAERAHLAGHRGARPGRSLGRRGRSSATSRSTTCAGWSSTPMSSGSGSDGPPRSMPSATPSSSCSPGTSRPLADRLAAISARLEDRARLLDQHRTRASGPAGPALAADSRSTPRTTCPRSSTRSSPPAATRSAAPTSARLERHRIPRVAPSTPTPTWLKGSLADATDDWALGRERVRRSWWGCGRSTGSIADAILEIGWQQLAENRAASRRGGPRDRPVGGRGNGHRPDQVRPPRGRSRRRSRPTAT